MEGRDWSSVPALSICRAGSAAGEGAGGGEVQAQALLQFAAQGTRDRTPCVLNPGATVPPIAVEKPCSQHTLTHGCS